MLAVIKTSLMGAKVGRRGWRGRVGSEIQVGGASKGRCLTGGGRRCWVMMKTPHWAPRPGRRAGTRQGRGRGCMAGVLREDEGQEKMCIENEDPDMALYGLWSPWDGSLKRLLVGCRRESTR